MTNEELVQKCKEFRYRAECSHAEFFLFLMEAESEHEDAWKIAGVSDFDQFIRSYDLCKPELYRIFVEGCNRVGREEALVCGYNYVMEVGRMHKPTPQSIVEMGNRSKAFVEITGTAPSRETVTGWRHELDSPSETTHQTVKKANELNKLRAENAQMRAEIKILTAENTELRRRLKMGKKVTLKGNRAASL